MPHPEHVGRLPSRALLIPLHLLGCVQRERLERVHRHQDRSDVGVDHVLPEPRSEDVEQRVLIEVVEDGKVFDLRVHGLGIAEAAVGAFSTAQNPRLMKKTGTGAGRGSWVGVWCEESGFGEGVYLW